MSESPAQQNPDLIGIGWQIAMVVTRGGDPVLLGLLALVAAVTWVAWKQYKELNRVRGLIEQKAAMVDRIIMDRLLSDQRQQRDDDE